MPEISKETAALLAFLMPGFFAAWIFYGFTSHPKPSQFERVVQALIFTVLFRAVLPLIQWLCEQIGSMRTFGAWNSTSDLIASLALAAVFGIALAYLTNTDATHRWLRDRGLTTRTSHPSEWYCVFAQHVSFVTLNLRDGRRLYGWPKEWPVEPDRGQFYIQLPSWLDEQGNEVVMSELDGILISAKDVAWVEFLPIAKAESNEQRAQGIEPTSA